MFVFHKTNFMANKAVLTLSERIDRLRDGRTQTSIVTKMNVILKDDGITEHQFSRKKKGYEEFTEKEIAALNEVLDTEITI